jgi:ribosomal protein S18 acetylase RimI-like enzyme
VTERRVDSMQGPAVQRLTKRAREELAQMLTLAFEQHPLVTVLGDRAGEATALVKALVDLHWRKDSLLLCGIRTDDGLVCGAVCVDTREDHSPAALLRLAWNVSRAAGRQAIGELLDVERRKPLYKERHLELVMMGTLPAHQRQGLGRALLRWLYREAVTDGYKGVLLVTDGDTPAFDLYRSEGFEVDREFQAGGQTLCWMRRGV